MIDLLQDLDELLQTGSKFLLGKWITDAKSWGMTEGVFFISKLPRKNFLNFILFILFIFFLLKEKIQYEWNARNQITLWGPRGEIRDYATKQWAGVVADYFKPRWEIFIREMQLALDEKRPFNKKAFEANVFATVEEPFTLATKHYPNVPIGENNRCYYTV
jgi:alpha-N-acetylglucosaminidase